MLNTVRPRVRLKGASPPAPTIPLPRVRVKGAAMPSASLPAPSAVEVERDWLRTGNVWHRTLAVVGYPREVNQGWLAPLLHGRRGA